MKNKFPVYEFLIDDTEESGVKCISVVADPAFQSKAILFEKSKQQFIELSESKPKKRRIGGLALIPNVLIYRVDEFNNPYYGFFSAETIEKIVEKFHEEMNNNKLNLNHNEAQFVDAILVEDYIVDTKERVEDLKKKGIEHDNIVGSWYVSYKIKNEETFNSIMENQSAGNPTGFSVEIFADRFLVEMNSQINKSKIKSEMKKSNKNLLEKIIDLFKKEILERSLVPELGFQIEWTEVGQPVNKVIVNEEGVETFEPLGAGEFITEVGIVVVDDASNLVEVRDLPVEEPQEEPELKLPDEEMDKVAEMESEPKIENQELPVEELPVEPAVVDVKSKTIGELVGENDGEYWIKVKVESGLVTEAEVSSETDLLKQKLQKLENENKDLQDKNKILEDKMKEPITEPVLEPPVEKKDWAKMSAYERAIYKSKLNK